MRPEATDEQVLTMASGRALPVLRDTRVAGVDQLYGIHSARSCLLFGRDGCLLPAEGEIPPQVMDNPRQLLPYIERIAR